MPSLDPETRTPDRPGSEPGPRTRQLAAGLLRLALGISLLNAGLARHLGTRMTNQVPGMVLLDASSTFLSGLAYLQIGVGLALILGFLLTLASAAACLILLIIPLHQMATELTGGRFVGVLIDPYSVAAMQSLPILMLPAVLMVWFSAVAYHPISMDALIFARDRAARAIRPPVLIIGEGPPAAGDETSPAQSSGG